MIPTSICISFTTRFAYMQSIYISTEKYNCSNIPPICGLQTIHYRISHLHPSSIIIVHRTRGKRVHMGGDTQSINVCDADCAHASHILWQLGRVHMLRSNFQIFRALDWTLLRSHHWYCAQFKTNHTSIVICRWVCGQQVQELPNRHYWQNLPNSCYYRT